MIGYDRFLSGKCPNCGSKMVIQPRTIIGGNAGAGKRYVYENFDCSKCDLKFSKLVRDDIPKGIA